MKTILLSTFLCLVPLVTAKDFSLSFYPRPDSVWKNDPRVVSAEEGPCGLLLQAKVKSLPDTTDPFIAVETIFEIGTSRYWRVPEAFVPLAVAGNEMLVAAYSNFYWIHRKGTLRFAEESEKNRYRSRQSDPGREFQCPGDSNSAYERCREFSDRKNGKSRQFRFETPCT